MDDFNQRLRVQVAYGLTRLNAGGKVVAAVAFDQDGHDVGTARMRQRLHGDDRAGDGSMHRDAESGAVTDFLPEQNMLPDGNQRLAGRADVLRHGNRNGLRPEGNQGRIAGQLFIAPRMDAAKKGTWHRHITSALFTTITIAYGVGKIQERKSRKYHNKAAIL